jgi:putative chitinase
LAAPASKDGLNKIDRVFPSSDGKRFFAIEGDMSNPAHHRVHVDAAQAKQQTLEQSTQHANQALQQAPDMQQQQNQVMRR